MTWVRLDEGMPEHPKVAQLSDAAFRLHVEGLCYCARMLTDGVITSVIARRLGTQKACKELLKSGLWLQHDDDSFLIHDYLDYQPSRAEVEDRRNKRSQAGKQGAESRWGRRKTMANPMASAMASAMANGMANGWQNDAPVPDPVPIPKEEQSITTSRAATDHLTIKDRTINPNTAASMERLLERLTDADKGTAGRLVKLAKRGASQADFEDARASVIELAPKSPSRYACHVVEERLNQRQEAH